MSCITNTYSDVVVEQHEEVTTTTTDTTASAVTIQQSEEVPQISTPLPVLPIEPTSTSLLQGSESMTDTPSTINQPETLLGLGMVAMSEVEFQSQVEQPSNVTTKKRRSSIPDTQPRKVMQFFFNLWCWLNCD